MRASSQRATSRPRGLRMMRFAAMFLLSGQLSIATALADVGPQQIDLEPGSLQQALDRLAELTQLQILYDPGLVRGHTTRGVSGAMTPAKAFEELLAPTDITFEFTAGDAVALHGKAHGDKGASRDLSGSDTPTRTITINADRFREGSYESPRGVPGMDVDAPSLIVPLTRQSLSQQVLRDQQVGRLEDVLEYVSGTGVVPDGESAVGFEIRGFPTYQYYVDGVRVSPDVHHDGFRDFANIDHVDILKGPASVHYGRTEPGGLVDIVTKQPLRAPMLSLEQQVGSFDRRRTQLDAGGPLNSEGSLRYRFNAAWESGASFREIPGNRRVFLSPVVTWTSSGKTETTAYLEYLNSHDPGDSGLPVIGDRMPPVPLSRSLDQGGQIHTTDLRVGLRGSHIFGNGWTLRHHVDARWLQAPQAPQLALAADGVVPIQCSPTNCAVDRELVAIPVAHGYTDFASVDLSHDASLWGTRHSLLAGIELFLTQEHSELQSKSDFSLTTDLFDPVNQPLPVSLLQNPDLESIMNTRERWGAVFVQDQTACGDKLYLLSGWRFDCAGESIGQTARTPDNGGYIVTL